MWESLAPKYLAHQSSGPFCTCMLPKEELERFITQISHYIYAYREMWDGDDRNDTEEVTP